MTGEPPRFNGSDYDPGADDARLAGQLARVRAVMRDGAWRTLAEIEAATGDPPASISAQLRHLRKARFGGWTVAKRARGDRAHGLFEYRVGEHPDGAEAVAARAAAARRPPRQPMTTAQADAACLALRRTVALLRRAGLTPDPALEPLWRELFARASQAGRARVRAEPDGRSAGSPPPPPPASPDDSAA